MEAQTYPEWQITVQMPSNKTFAYKYVRRESNGTWIYETENRTITTGDCNTRAHSCDRMVCSPGLHEISRGFNFESSVPPPQHSNIRQKSGGSMSGLPERNLIDPPYHIHNGFGLIGNKTIRTDLTHSNGLKTYDTHNFYGSMMSAASRDAMLQRRPSMRPMVITRSTFAGAGNNVGQWFGDNNADWDRYRWSIAELQEFVALYQIPMVGSDVCGFTGTTTDELCSRWVFLGAFSPFFRNHQSIGEQPHELYRTPVIAAAARAAIAIRYRLLDYTYTAMWTQTQTGAPMLKPMFFGYPQDDITADLPYQFFWGSSIMVAPVTEENSTAVSVYLPNDLFYNFYTGAPVRGRGSHVNLTGVGYDSLPLYYKGGSIIPQRVMSANTTTQLRNENFEIVIAPNEMGKASGTLYLDDGGSIEQPYTSLIKFDYCGGEFSMTGNFDYDVGNVTITQIRVLDEDVQKHTGHISLARNYYMLLK